MICQVEALHFTLQLEGNLGVHSAFPQFALVIIKIEGQHFSA